MTQNTVCPPFENTIAPDDHNSPEFGKKPVVIYDGDCGLCKLWVVEWKKSLKEIVHFAPSQLVAEHFPYIRPDEFKNAVQLALPGKTHFGGAEAVYTLLSYSQQSWHRKLLPLYKKFSPFRLISNFGYRFVSTHRPLFFSLSKFLLRTTH